MKNLFLHSMNRIYDKAKYYLSKISKKLQDFYDGLFDIVVGKLSKKFISMDDMTAVFGELTKRANEANIQLLNSNATSLYKNDFDIEWTSSAKNKCTIMELYLSSQTIDISNEFSLLQFLNFPFPIENEYYYIETEETFLAINQIE